MKPQPNQNSRSCSSRQVYCQFCTCEIDQAHWWGHLRPLTLSLLWVDEWPVAVLHRNCDLPVSKPSPAGHPAVFMLVTLATLITEFLPVRPDRGCRNVWGLLLQISWSIFIGGGQQMGNGMGFITEGSDRWSVCMCVCVCMCVYIY